MKMQMHESATFVAYHKLVVFLFPITPIGSSGIYRAQHPMLDLIRVNFTSFDEPNYTTADQAAQWQHPQCVIIHTSFFMNHPKSNHLIRILLKIT